MSSFAAIKISKIPKLTINEWLENLPSKLKTQKINQLVEKCPVSKGTVYRWINNESVPHKRIWKTIQEVAGKDMKIIFK